METLLELYDDRPIENVLATEVFRPKRTIYLCPADIAENKQLQEKLQQYFARHGLNTELIFLESSLYNSEKVLKQLRKLVKKYPDCTLDITGGTDSTLFAGGLLCAELPIPTFTYARRTNCFYNIQNAPFAEKLPCTVQHNVEDCFLMAGGSLRPGRVDNKILSLYFDQFDSFFQIFLRYRIRWTQIIKFFQIVSQVGKGQKIPLNIVTDNVVCGDRGSKLSAPVDCLMDLEKIGFLKNVNIDTDKVRFSFRDQQIRTWLRDVGSVLELYVYKACLDTGLFNDVITSAVVDWEGFSRHGDVTNEIDVMAMQGILPAFISCKTCEASTESLNELAILRDRFGGKSAKAAIVTAKNCNSITRHRAAELYIDVIDLSDLKAGHIQKHLRSMMRSE